MTDTTTNIEAVDDEQEAVDSVEIEAEGEAPPPAPEWDAEVADEARFFGWKPTDEWQGDMPAGFIENPSDYLDRVHRSRTFKAMQERLNEVESRSAEQSRKMEAVTKAAVERQRQQYEGEIASLKAAQRQAAEIGDMDAFDRTSQAMERLQPPQPMPEAAPQVDPVLEGYLASEQGAWLNNPVLADTAKRIVGGNPAMATKSMQEQIDYAEQEVRKMYPHYFPQAEPERPKPRNVVDGGGLGAPQTRGGSKFAKLPPDAKAEFQRNVKLGLFKDTNEDKEWFANEYDAA